MPGRWAFLLHLWTSIIQFEIVGISRELVRTLSDDVRKNGAYPQIGRFYLDAGEAKYKKVYERLVIRNKHPEVPREAQCYADN